MSNSAKFCKHVKISHLTKIQKLKDIFKTIKVSLVFTDNLTNLTYCFYDVRYSFK